MERNKELEKVMEKKFLTAAKFSMEIETIVANEKINYIDAICQYCEMNDIEVDSISKLISLPRPSKIIPTSPPLIVPSKSLPGPLPISIFPFTFI